MRRKCNCIILLLFCVILLAGCERRRRGLPSATATPTVGVSTEADMTGVVRSIDLASRTITLQNIATDQELAFLYSGATSFVSKNEKELAPTQIEPGEVVDIYCKDKAVTKIQISSEVETAENVRNLLVKSEESYVQMGEAKYRYTKGVVVVSNRKPIDIMEVTAMDMVSVRYVEGRIYSVIVTKGHGYIKPVNYEDFIGGSMTVEGQTILPVSENMLVTVPEGTYEISMKNGDFKGSRKMTVDRDEEIELDMSLFKSQPENTGQVVFDIHPEGAELYVNGATTSYKKPVSLKYGEHDIIVRLEGYTDYKGVLDVESPNPTVKIDLAKEEAEVDSSDEDSTVEKDTDESDDTDSTSTTRVDNDHKITVSEPAGASVYLNGTYKGVAPCSFKKAIGTQTITLSQDGYTTKSYTVEISDDGEDILWNFPAMVKSGS